MTTLTHPNDTVEASPALRLDHVGKTFDNGSTVLEDINMTIHQGEFIALVGPSGCGKTTLLRIIQGLETATAGSIAAQTGYGTTPRMSFVFQRASLLPWYTVRQNVAFGATLRAGRSIYPSKKHRDEAIDRLLEMTGLSRYAGYYPDQISGGMQQRVNVARALAVEPDVLMLDEPFSALDALTRERLQVDIAEILHELGTTAVLVTHDIREAVFLADRIVVLAAHPGRVHETVAIDQARPRPVDFQHSAELGTLERSIWSMLH